MTDLYEILQVHPRAHDAVLRAAYRALARELHPDAGGSHAAMVRLNDAWAVLGHPERRAAYDAAARGMAGREAAAPDAASATRPDRPANVIDFGRYEGWSIRDLARQDPNYLEWLARTPAGRPYVRAIRAELDRLAPATAAAPAVPPIGSRMKRGDPGRFAFARR